MSESDIWRFGMFERCLLAFFILITGAFLSFLTYNLLSTAGEMGSDWQPVLSLISLAYLTLAVAFVVGPPLEVLVGRFIVGRFGRRQGGDA